MKYEKIDSVSFPVDETGRIILQRKRSSLGRMNGDGEVYIKFNEPLICVEVIDRAICHVSPIIDGYENASRYANSRVDKFMRDNNCEYGEEDENYSYSHNGTDAWINTDEEHYDCFIIELE